jgi:uncharacterized protein (DUF2236 family)
MNEPSLQPAVGSIGLRLPKALRAWIESAAHELMSPDGLAVDFAAPAGEPALAPPDSVSWRIFKNPVALFVGGVAAVILELAEPRVRAGVWGHSSFRSDPVDRLQRTGLAAMVTVYGARSVARGMIAGVRRAHDRVQGTTDGGLAYRANDPALLDWVQATAAFGFLEAYAAYVAPVAAADRDAFFAEGEPAALLYGATGAPRSQADLDAMFATVRPRLQASPVVLDFLAIMRAAPVLPGVLRGAQGLFVRAAVEIAPPWLRADLGLGPRYGLRRGEALLVRAAGRAAERLVLRTHPAVQACRRLGLPDDYLYRRS